MMRIGEAAAREFVIALVASLWLGIGCQRQANQPRNLPPPKVAVAHPVRQPVTEYHEFTGQTEAVESAEVRARVRGYLVKIDFQEGTEVAQNTLLYEIDPREFQANVAKAEADVLRAQAQLALAQTEEQRSLRLRASNAATEEEYQQRIAARQQAEAAVKQAEAAAELAKLDLSYTRIVAPIAGRVGRTQVTVGNLVGVNEPTLLTTIVRLDPIYVYFEAPERQYLDYQKRIREQGAASAEQRKVPAFIALETDEDFPHQGVIDFRENRVDAGTGTITIRAVVPNPDRIIAPGMFARIRVPIGAPTERLLVPQMAVSSDQRGDYVLIVTPDNTVEYRAVKTGHSEGDLVVILDGLSDTDLVIVTGGQKTRPGGRVTTEQAQTVQAQSSTIARQPTTNAAKPATESSQSPLPSQTQLPSETPQPHHAELR
jgi:RND family efflux transporter MFP subunit